MMLKNNSKQKHILVYVINVDWYFELHWLQRALATMEAGFEVHLIMTISDVDILKRLANYGFICHPWAMDRKSLNPFLNLKAAIAVSYTHLTLPTIYSV